MMNLCPSPTEQCGDDAFTRLLFGSRNTVNPLDRDPNRAPWGTETILLVEDERQLAEVVDTVLTARGYTVLTAADGRSALELSVKHGRDIKVVLADLRLPDLDGLEVCRRITSDNPRARTILSTGWTERTLGERARAAGVRHVVSKPYEMRALLDLIRTVLDEDLA